MPKLTIDDKDLAAEIIKLQSATGKITGQGVAVVNATDATSVIAQLNALLASLRTAGVIAP
ncbi:hypothetical protein [Bradyrhizobium cenepequi]